MALNLVVGSLEFDTVEIINPHNTMPLFSSYILQSRYLIRQDCFLVVATLFISLEAPAVIDGAIKIINRLGGGEES